jgi:hypothetical protein
VLAILRASAGAKMWLGGLKGRSTALLLLLPACESLSLYGGGARVLHRGDRYLPPLVEVPGVGLPLARIVKPPDPEELWEWSCEQHGAGSDMDVTWASVWPAAAALAAHLDGNRHLVEGLRVVELGSGLGVAGPLLLSGRGLRRLYRTAARRRALFWQSAAVFSSTPLRKLVPAPPAR